MERPSRVPSGVMSQCTTTLTSLTEGTHHMETQQLARIQRWLIASLVLMVLIAAFAVIGWVQLYLAVNDVCEAVNDLAGEPICGHLDGWGE